MSIFLRCVITFSFIIIFPLIACNSQTVSQSTSTTQYPTTGNTTITTTTQKPTGVPGSTLLPENAPQADHFLGGGGCLEHHGVPSGHDGELLNEFGCDRCHIQASTIIPTIIPTNTE